MRATEHDYTPEGLAKRLRTMERSIADLNRKGDAPARHVESGGSGPAIIDMGDSAVFTGFSKAWYAVQPFSISSIVATVDSAGTTATVANIYHGSTYLGDVTIPADGNVSSPLAAGINLEPGEFWQALVTQAGVGASGLTFYGATS